MIRRLFNSVLEGTAHVPKETTSIYPNPSILNDTNIFKWLTTLSPCFPVSSTSIKIITEPKQFYETVLRNCKTAKTRVNLVSLYLGSGDLEKQLVKALMENEHFKGDKLVINVLLDYTRGSRDNKDNSRTTLQPLLRKNEANCTVSLYHTPVLRGLLKKIMPNRYNELVGLQHMKLYIFDDTLIISGANLSKDYFTNRQDRYFVIEDKKLSDFYCNLVKKVQRFSLKMDKNNEVSLSSEWKVSPYEGNKREFVEQARNVVEQYLVEYKEQQNTHITQNCDTWIFPTFQMGQLGIQHDSLIIDKILAESPEGSHLKLATGYFNLTTQYMNTITYDCRANCDILMAHPRANGFLGAEGPAGGIPYAYSLIARKFMNHFENNGQKFRIKMLEYLRNGWTYHAKGLWYYPPNGEYPCMTVVGSPNFGDRSVTKDLETQCVIVTENDHLQKQLHQECQRLFERGLPANTHRKVPLWVNVFVFFF